MIAIHFVCSACGDVIDYKMTSQEQYHRNSHVSVLVGGTGSYANLLEIIPFLRSSIGGAIIVLLDVENASELKNLAEYMDSISQICVLRGEVGVSIEAGNCYLLAYSDCLNIKNSPLPTFIRIAEDESRSSVDLLLGSVSRVFTNHSSVVFLSGSAVDAGSGVNAYGSNVKLLKSRECFFPELTASIETQLGAKLQRISTSDIVSNIIRNHMELNSQS